MKYVSVMAATVKAARQAVPELTDEQADAVAGAVYGAVEGTIGALRDEQRTAILDDLDGGRVSCAQEHASVITGLDIAAQVLRSMVAAEGKLGEDDAVEVADPLETDPSWTAEDVKLARAHVGRDVLLNTSRGERPTDHERGRLVGVAVDGSVLVIGVDVAGGV